MAKRIVSIIMILVCMLCCATVASAAEEKVISVYVDGNKIEFDVPPTSENGRTLVPLRYIFEALGATVEWIQEESRAIAQKDGIIIDLTLGSDVMYRNDAPITLDVAAKAVDGRILVPARAVSEALDADVVWDADTYSVIITSNDFLRYNYKELSPQDLDKLKALYLTMHENYIDLLYENMNTYPKDIYDLLIDKDERIRMFADDVWNNMMAYEIINIQTDSEDWYIFDLPEEVEIDSYTLMEDYLTITDALSMSAEYAISTHFETDANGQSALFADFIYSDDTNDVLENAIVIVPENDGFKFFVRKPYPDEGYDEYSELAKDTEEEIVSPVA